jgi:Flp pilus assembly pilin Flp
MLRLLKRLWRDQSAQDLVEYVLLMIMVSLGVIASARSVGQSVANGMVAAASNLTVNTPGSNGDNHGQGNGHGDGDGNGHGNGNGNNGNGNGNGP